MSNTGRLLLAASMLLGVQQPSKAEKENFYTGRMITLSTFASPGGSYDTYLRLLSQTMGKYILGHPSIIVVNQPGAGGFTAANYAGNAAPKDGTFATLMSIGVVVQGALGNSALRTPLQNFNWLGNFTKNNNVIVTSEQSAAATIEDATAREVTLGSLGAGSIDAQLPSLCNQLLGTKFKVIYGYDGTPQILVAMERGEVEGQSNIWPTLKAAIPNEGARRLHVLIQTGVTKERDLPHTPLLTDLVKGDPDKEKMAEFMTLATMISRPLAAPPGVPNERIGVLRQAFDATINDPEFLAQAGKAGFNISPMSGEEVQSAINELISSPKATLDALKGIFAFQPR
jgi:tripartite-type tricarboxylate transporter receptor subunit TctC